MARSDSTEVHLPFIILYLRGNFLPSCADVNTASPWHELEDKFCHVHFTDEYTSCRELKG